MIKIIKSWETITPESAEDGDFAETGIHDEESVTFSELVYLFKTQYTMPCSSHDPDCFSTGFDIIDYRTCEEEEKSIHYRDTDYKYKYWQLASKLAHGRDYFK